MHLPTIPIHTKNSSLNVILYTMNTRQRITIHYYNDPTLQRCHQKYHWVAQRGVYVSLQYPFYIEQNQITDACAESSSQQATASTAIVCETYKHLGKSLASNECV